MKVITFARRWTVSKLSSLKNSFYRDFKSWLTITMSFPINLVIINSTETPSDAQTIMTCFHHVPRSLSYWILCRNMLYCDRLKTIMPYVESLNGYLETNFQWKIPWIWNCSLLQSKFLRFKKHISNNVVVALSNCNWILYWSWPGSESTIPLNFFCVSMHCC